MIQGKECKLPSSFRDPSGFVFCQDGQVYRQINKVYADEYQHLMQSGLYYALVAEDLLIPHTEVDTLSEDMAIVHRIIKPEQILFISYPYEWCFTQLKHAALHTLKVQNIALRFGMSLKDSSAYNIQFRNGRPVFIDTLSFERYHAGQPWIAYRQFCRHFLAPLALMCHKDLRMNQLFKTHVDGIPLDIASSLLPVGSYFSYSLLLHIHMHAKGERIFIHDTDNKKTDKRKKMVSMEALIDSVYSAIVGLNVKSEDTEWSGYYSNTNYSDVAMQYKKQLVVELLERAKPTVLCDIGANSGLFSRLASDRNIYTIATDNDPMAVEQNYMYSVNQGEKKILPLIIDITNPSSGIGWLNQERTSFLERLNVDTVMALALIHHLVISNNLQLGQIAQMFSSVCKSLIIEFVPKSDSQTQRLLISRKDIFGDYTQEAFEDEFSQYFIIEQSSRIKESDRTLYLMRKK